MPSNTWKRYSGTRVLQWKWRYRGNCSLGEDEREVSPWPCFLLTCVLHPGLDTGHKVKSPTDLALWVQLGLPQLLGMGLGSVSAQGAGELFWVPSFVPPLCLVFLEPSAVFSSFKGWFYLVFFTAWSDSSSWMQSGNCLVNVVALVSWNT